MKALAVVLMACALYACSPSTEVVTQDAAMPSDVTVTRYETFSSICFIATRGSQSIAITCR